MIHRGETLCLHSLVWWEDRACTLLCTWLKNIFPGSFLFLVTK